MTKSKILIVEDDLFILKAMRLTFESAGLKVKTCQTAESGLQLISHWIPDLIVLDVLLPGIDGYAFLRQIKADKKLQNIPVIISSNLSDETKHDDLGVVDYIVKSELDLNILLAKIIKRLS
jgi:CheY-like chemotaxis protein